MEFVVEDGTYVYEVYGEGPPVVLLHGFTGSSSTWSSFISKYKAHFQLMVIDLQVHGQTNLHTPRDMASCCQDLRQLFIHLEVSPVHLVGYSMGTNSTVICFNLPGNGTITYIGKFIAWFSDGNGAHGTSEER